MGLWTRTAIPVTKSDQSGDDAAVSDERMAPLPAARVRGRLWDLPTRIIHWALVLLIAFAWWSAHASKMEWHRWAGYGVLGLILFRLVWGFWGSASARFSNFVRGPLATLAYVRTLPDRAHAETPGHNPLGAWSVLALLTAILVQVVTGLFAVDVDGEESGPLSYRVSFETGRAFAKWHTWSFTAIEGLVVIHLAAILFYLLYKRTNLVQPMITGWREFEADPGVTMAPLWRVLALGVIVAAATYWVMTGLRI